MATGKKPASLAAKALGKKSTPKSEKTVAASDLAQTSPEKPKKKPKKK